MATIPDVITNDRSVPGNVLELPTNQGIIIINFGQQTRPPPSVSKKAKILFLFFLWHFGYFIAAVKIYANVVNNAKNECGQLIYYCIMCCFIVHSIHIGITFASFSGYLYGGNITEWAFNTSQVLILLSSIWPITCLYGTKSDCVTKFEENYKFLWNMLQVEAYTYLVVSTLIVCFTMYNISSRYDYTYNFRR